MNIAKEYGNSYESAFFDVALDGVGVPASMGELFAITYPQGLPQGGVGLDQEFNRLNPGPGSQDLLMTRDFGGIPCPPQAMVVEGPVAGGFKDFFNYNEDIKRFDPNGNGPVTGGVQDISTTAYLAYVNSQLQSITQEQSAREFSRVL